MDVSRAERISNILKTTKQLGKDIKKPISLPKLYGQSDTSGVPKAIEGSGIIKIMMYVVAGLLLIGIILLIVDQWITPIFKRSPGGSGYIPIPGTDLSQVYWQTPSTVGDILIGTPPPSVPVEGAPAIPIPLSTTVIEGQSNYSITMDICINDEAPQSIGINNKRVFFMLGQTVATPTLSAWIDNSKNTAYVTVYTSDMLQDTVAVENVPIHTSFRIGIVNTHYALEGYLNGKLVMTRQKRGTAKVPTTGDTIFSPANIIENKKVLSQNIKVLNVRVFGYSVSPSEMQGRMDDLISTTVFNPPAK